MNRNNEFTKEDLVIDRDMEADEHGRITAYVETWFDVDKKFGVHTAQDDDTWLNMYAVFDVAADSLAVQCVISGAESENTFSYVPTPGEAALLKTMIRETCLRDHGCTAEEYIVDILEGGTDIERKAKDKLIARLDECLKEHAVSITADGGLPDIKDIYELEDLAALHYYLKVEHEFTPVEVEALWSFKDPLNVARWCKEENSHEHSFPICELLNEINAYQRFEKAESGTPLAEKYVELVKLLGRNLIEYKTHMLDCGEEEIYERAEEIAAANAAYAYMAGQYHPHENEVDFLLRHDNPLQLICEFWPEKPCELMPMNDVIDTLMDNYCEPPEERTAPPKSLRERLQSATREIKERPQPVNKPRGGEAR